MPLTRDFKDTVRQRAEADPTFRAGLLAEAVECLLGGEIDAGKVLLRDYVNATVGFQELAALIDKKPESLMRMLGPGGNPQASNLFQLLAQLQKCEGVRFEVRAAR